MQQAEIKHQTLRNASDHSSRKQLQTQELFW